MIRIKKTYNVLLEENKKLKYSLDNKSSNDKIIISSLKRINSILNDKLDHSKSLIEYLFDNNEKALDLCDHYEENYKSLNKIYESLYKDYIISLAINGISIIGIIIAIIYLLIK